MGNSNTSEDPRPTHTTVVEDDETSKLDPKIKAFLLDGTRYTSFSISKETAITPQAKPFVPVQANANLDPDLVAVRALKLLAPLFPGPKTKQWFPEGAEERFFKNLPKVDVWPLLMALQDFQGYLNESGVLIGNKQNALNERIRVTEILMTKVLHSCAMLGTEIQNFEMGIRNIHVMEHNIRMTTEKLNTTLKKTFAVLDMIPNYERASLIPPFDVLKPFLRKDQYVSVNLIALTRYIPEVTAKERELEDFWLQNILPHWDDALVAKKAVGWWRAGIPARLRGYVWKRLIGNRLNITPHVYTEWQEKAQLKFGPPPDDIYDESSQEDSETIARQAQAKPTTPVVTPRQNTDVKEPEETKPAPIPATTPEQKPDAAADKPAEATDAAKPEEPVEAKSEEAVPPAEAQPEEEADPEEAVTPDVAVAADEKPAEVDVKPEAAVDAKPEEAVTPDVAVDAQPDEAEKTITEAAPADEKPQEAADASSQDKPTNPTQPASPTTADPQPSTDVPAAEQPSTSETKDTTEGEASEPENPEQSTQVDPAKLKSIVDQFQAKVYPNRPNARQIIIRDVPRTLPDLRIFDKLSTPAARQLLGVLETAAIFTDTGYIQGMSYLCGVLLMFMNHYDAFVAFTNLIELPFLKSVCKIDLGLIAKHSQLFQMVFLQNMPALYNHFNDEGVTTEHFLLDWWLTLFSKSVSLPVAFRIWDCFLVEGELFLHLAAVGILKVFEEELLGASFESCLDSLSHIPRKVSADALFEAIKKFTITPKIQAIIDEMHR